MGKLQFRSPSGIFPGGWVAPGSWEKIRGGGIYIPSSPAFGTSLLEKEGLCVWGSRNLQLPFEALACGCPLPHHLNPEITGTAVLQFCSSPVWTLSPVADLMQPITEPRMQISRGMLERRQKWKRQIGSSSSLQLWNPFPNCSLAGLRGSPGPDGDIITVSTRNSVQAWQCCWAWSICPHKTSSLWPELRRLCGRQRRPGCCLWWGTKEIVHLIIALQNGSRRLIRRASSTLCPSQDPSPDSASACTAVSSWWCRQGSESILEICLLDGS